MERKHYTTAQIQFLRDNYPELSRKELTAAFNTEFEEARELSSIVAACKNKKITSGRTGCFVKGEQPWNTGTVGICKPNSGTFKKGNRPVNWKPVGHQRTGTDGYVMVKVEEPNKFRLKHQLTWEQNHGDIPEGMVLWFIDGDRSNCELSNLELIKKTEQMRRNKLQVNQAPDEIQSTLKLVAKMQVATSENVNKLEPRK